MKVLLVYLRYDGDVYMDSYEQDHLGMGYLASVMRQAGHEVEMFNAHWLGLSLEETIERIDPKQYDLLGIPAHVETLNDLNRLTEHVAQTRDVPIVLGGHWPSMQPKVLFEELPRVTHIAMGEGEFTFCELADALEKGGELGEILGLAWRDGDEVVVNKSRPLIADLDMLPFPHHDDLEVYLQPEWAFKKRTANVLASRGCYAFCSYCSIVAMYARSPGPAVRVRSPKRVVDEIEWLMNRYRVNQIFFSDDNFLGPEKVTPGWGQAFAQEIIDRELDIRFIFMCRVDDITLETFTLLKQAGLVGVAMGIESDVDRVLERYNKQTTKSNNRTALKILRDLRIDPLISFIMFDPYTKLNDLRENLAFFEEIDYIRYCHYTRPVTLMAGYSLKTYGGTSYTKKVGRDGFNADSEYDYDCEFEDPATFEVFHILQRWRVTILQLIMHNPLWMIDMAHRLGRTDLVYKVHGQARKYTKLDMRLFHEIIDLVEQGHRFGDEACEELLRAREQDAAPILARLSELRDELNAEHLRKSRTEVEVAV